MTGRQGSIDWGYVDMPGMRIVKKRGR